MTSLKNYVLSELWNTSAICVIFTETLEKSETWKNEILNTAETTSAVFEGLIFVFGLDQEAKSHNSYHGQHLFLIDFHVAANSALLQSIKNTCTSSRSSIHIINNF